MTVREIYENLPYGPAPESAQFADEWLERFGRDFGLFIGGKWHPPASVQRFASVNPANGKPLAQISQAGPEDVDAAVAAARQAQAGWAALSGHKRARYLYAIARQIQKHSRLLAVLETMDNGKPIRETRDIDVPLVARHFYHHAGWAQLMDTEMAGYEPVGVCAQIIPWNFPLMMLAWKIAPALAMGNTVVLKPAEFTSLTALAFAEICREIGLPPGVVNIVTGDGETGKLMVAHPGVDKLAFTGSTDVGRILRRATAGSGKKLSLELGGKSPFLVFEDADLDSAVEGLVDAIWFNQGQVCCAGSRLLVQESVAERVLAKTRARMERLRVGDPLDKAVDLGAIVDKVQLDRISELVEQGVAEGATKFQPSAPCPKNGWFYPPTLLTNVGPASTVVQVEIFGPVLVAMSFRTPDEAIALANNTPYGLAASVWSENISLALDIADRVKAGTVWVNCTNQFDAASGFGGYRESGYGREGGREGLWEYVKPVAAPAKTVKGDSADASTIAARPGIDRTHKMYVGGKQARPDGGYSVTLSLHGGGTAEVARGNRKDVRNAVEAARNAQVGWAAAPTHLRAQVLYYLAENLEAERDTMVRALADTSGNLAGAAREVDATIERTFAYAAWADKFEGAVHATPFRGLNYTRPEPVGAIGIVCPEDAGLLAMMSLALPAIAMGNAVVVLPSQTHPLAACALYRVLDTSDVPGGVFNILTGPHEEMQDTLAAHDGLDAIWHFGNAEAAAEAERLSAGNLKQTWTSMGNPTAWDSPSAAGKPFLRRATQVKNIWVPTGD